MKNFYVKLIFVFFILLISFSVNAQAKCGVNNFAVFEECRQDYNAVSETTYDSNGNVVAVSVPNIVYEVGYKYAKYECYDGTVYREGSESSCKSSETWSDYARKACENKCSEEIIIEEPETELFKESVKCVFINATNNQACYASDWDSGREYECYARIPLQTTGTSQTTSQTNIANAEVACVVEGISGKKGTSINWKSTCGEYASTVIDGVDKTIRFDCTPTANPNPIEDVFCNREYAPVCGETKVVCVKAPCEPIKITYANKCELEKANARYLYSGECKEDEVFVPQRECLCTMNYDPVCAVRSVCESKCYAEADRNTNSNTNVIVTSDGSYTVKEDYTQKCESSCYEQKETYSNSCQAECAGAKIIYRGECGTQAQCQKQDYEAVRILKDRCYSVNGKIVELEDTQGCPYYECVLPDKPETGQCRTKDDIVEKVASCENEGGKFYGRFDEQGCLVTADCIREGRIDSNVEVTKVPSATVLLEMALKLEDLKIEFGQLKSKIAGIADYYRNEGDTNTAEKFDKVVEIIVSAQNDISLIKEKISQNIDSFDLEIAREIKEAIRRINEERITEIVKVILSS